MAISIMRGDSYPILVDLKQDGISVTPDIISDIEVCVGDDLRFTYSEKTLAYDTVKKQWYFWPTQEETFALQEGSYDVYIRIKYPNKPSQVYGFRIDRIRVSETLSEEVI